MKCESAFKFSLCTNYGLKQYYKTHISWWEASFAAVLGKTALEVGHSAVVLELQVAAEPVETGSFHLEPERTAKRFPLIQG